MFFRNDKKKVFGWLIISLTLSGCLLKKKNSDNGDDDTNPTAPVFQDEIIITDNQPVYTSEYVLPMRRSSKINYKVSVANLEGKELSKTIQNEGVSIAPLSRNDGLTDVTIIVPFKITTESVGGFKIHVSVLDDPENPIEMTTQVSFEPGLYLTPHRLSGSYAMGQAVFTEDVFRNPTSGGLLEQMERVMFGEEGKDADADADLLAVREAWILDGNTLIQKAPAVLAVANPGKATIKTNGFPLTIIGNDWSGVTIQVGKCERGEYASKAKCRGEGDVFDLFNLTMIAPKIIEAQRIVENGVEIGAFDGAKGQDVDETNMLDICEKTIYSLKIPDNKKKCTNGMEHFNGSDIKAIVKLISSPIIDVMMDQSDFREYLDMKLTERKYHILDGQKNPCTDETCVFDFDGEHIDIVDGEPAPSESYKNQLEKMVEENKPKYNSSTYRLVKADEQTFYFDFERKDWQKHVAGYEGVWKTDGVKNWANQVCNDKMDDIIDAWRDKRLPNVTHVESYSSEAKTGYKDNDFSLSKEYNEWAIAETGAKARVEGTSTNGNFEIQLIAKKGDSAFTDDSLGISEQDGQKVLTLRGKALEALKPVARELEIQGYSGGDGFKTAYVASFSNTDLSGVIVENLTGKPGPKGKSWVRNDFRKGTVSYDFYWQGADGQIERKIIKNADGQPCHDEEIERGLCFINFKSQAARIDASGPKFLFKYKIFEIKGNYREPWVGFDFVTGTDISEHNAEYPGWNGVLGLEDPQPGLDVVFLRNNDNVMLRERSGNQRGTDPSKATPSSSVKFYGMTMGQWNDINSFNISCCKKAIDLAGKVGGYVLNPLAVADDILNGLNDATGGERRSRTELNGPVQRVFRQTPPDVNGRFTWLYYSSPDALREYKNEKEITNCSILPGVGEAKFKTEVEYTPQRLNIEISDVIVDAEKEANWGVKRELNLAETITAIQEKIEPKLLENPLFSDVKSFCDEEKCYTDLKFIVGYDKKFDCKTENLMRKCEEKEVIPDYELGRIVWFENQTGYLEETLATCKEKIKGKNEEYNNLLKTLASNSSSPFITALEYFDTKRIEDINALANELAPLKGSFWKATDVKNKDLRSYLNSTDLKNMVEQLNNIGLDSITRVATEKTLTDSGFKWNDLKPDEVKEVNATLATAILNYPEFPSAETIEEIQKNVVLIADAIKPQMKNLVCAYEFKGVIEYYPDSKRNEEDKYLYGDMFPYLVPGSLHFGDAKDEALSLPIQNGKVWEMLGGEDIVINISIVNDNATNDKLILGLPDTAKPGKKETPLTSVIGNCQNLGYIADKEKLPYSKSMFEKGCKL